MDVAGTAKGRRTPDKNIYPSNNNNNGKLHHRTHQHQGRGAARQHTGRDDDGRDARFWKLIHNYYLRARKDDSVNVHWVDDYDEALKLFSAHLHTRIQVLLKLAKTKQLRDCDVRVIFIPMWFDMMTPMTGENIHNLMHQADEDMPMSKWLAKRGQTFMTSFAGQGVKEKVLFVAVLTGDARQ